MKLTNNQIRMLQYFQDNPRSVYRLKHGEGTTIRSLIKKDLIEGAYKPATRLGQAGTFSGHLTSLGQMVMKKKNFYTTS